MLLATRISFCEFESYFPLEKWHPMSDQEVKVHHTIAFISRFVFLPSGLTLCAPYSRKSKHQKTLQYLKVPLQARDLDGLKLAEIMNKANKNS
mmetsp:Transcript_39952/g.72007  ORF Transcript_39952/g.72007 Transcript_39952/m.72007 type:complete len:93 (+) Transcript_39952:763-1041(+)